MDDVLVLMKGIDKSFPGVRALDDCDLDAFEVMYKKGNAIVLKNN